MKRSTKILLGLATIWMPIYMVLFMLFIFGMMAFSIGQPDPSLGPVFGVGILFVFVLHFLTIMLSLGMTVFYIIHAIKNESLESNMKAMWAVLFFIGGIIAEPIYWYLYIWKAPEDGGATGLLGGANTSTWDFESRGTRQGEYQPPSEPPDWR